MRRADAAGVPTSARQHISVSWSLCSDGMGALLSTSLTASERVGPTY